ncbi:MAG: metal-dependent hydrolase [Pseudomonadota bacterium]
MKFTWLGHSGFRIEIGDQVLLLDPWITNPLFPAEKRAEAITGATHILLSHGHFDHSGDTVALAKELDIPVVGIFDLISYWEGAEGIKAIGFNKGGTVMLGDVAVTMVNAVHSSSVGTDHGPMYAGSEAGFVLNHGNRAVYFAGDTDVMMDMELIEDIHHPEIGILPVGGHFTMDIARAAYAANRFFNFKTLIPCHYKTFPLLAQEVDDLVQRLPNTNVVDPVIMETFAL